MDTKIDIFFQDFLFIFLSVCVSITDYAVKWSHSWADSHQTLQHNAVINTKHQDYCTSAALLWQNLKRWLACLFHKPHVSIKHLAPSLTLPPVKTALERLMSSEITLQLTSASHLTCFFQTTQLTAVITSRTNTRRTLMVLISLMCFLIRLTGSGWSYLYE